MQTKKLKGIWRVDMGNLQAKGYTKDNVWVISQIANAMKWDSTHEERVLFAKWVLSLEGGEFL